MIQLIAWFMALILTIAQSCVDKKKNDSGQEVLVLKQRPIFRFHGLFGQCINDRYKYGFQLLGLSQGGLIARVVFQLCPSIRPYVKFLMTIGTPNMGTQKVDLNLLQTLTNSSYDILYKIFSEQPQCSMRQFRNEVVEGEEDPVRYKLSPLIVDLLTKNSDDDIRKPREENKIYEKLSGMVNAYFTKDEIVIPPESAIFNINTTDKFSKLESNVLDDNLLKESVGITELYNKGRLFSCRVEGTHLKPSDTYPLIHHLGLAESYEIGQECKSDKDCEGLYQSKDKEILTRLKNGGLDCTNRNTTRVMRI